MKHWAGNAINSTTLNYRSNLACWRRFRDSGWTCFLVLVTTFSFDDGVLFSSFLVSEWFGTFIVAEQSLNAPHKESPGVLVNPGDDPAGMVISADFLFIIIRVSTFESSSNQPCMCQNTGNLII